MPSLIDLTKRSFPSLKILHRIGTHPTRKSPSWLCECKCSKNFEACSADLLSKHVVSCGCVRTENARNLKLSHGKENSPEYQVWEGMKQRCKNKKKQNYHRYGGRGIKVDPCWEDFVQFYADMGPRPSVKHSIERKDTNGHYKPSNCYWATRREQNRNKINNRLISFGGETLCLQDWAFRYGLSKSTLSSRLYAGWSIEASLTTPRRSHHANCVN